MFAKRRADVRNSGKVIYSDVPNEKLIRVTNEHEDNFFSGILVDKIFANTETLEERYREPAEEEEEANEEGKVWDSFLGSDKSKLFGIYTHCQYGQEEIEEITFSDKILLLQIGENGFNDEGVFSVTIPRDDLKKLNFDNCEFAWGQS